MVNIFNMFFLLFTSKKTNPQHQCYATDRSVFAQLAERRESFLVCLANPVDHLLCVWTQHVALRTLLLLLILFLLVSVVSDR